MNGFQRFSWVTCFLSPNLESPGTVWFAPDACLWLDLQTSLSGSCCTKRSKTGAQFLLAKTKKTFFKSGFQSSPRKSSDINPILPSIYSGLLAFISVVVLLQASSKRIRRANPSLNTCALHIAADHSFLKHVGSGSKSVTVAEMVYHVAMTDKAFRATDFNQDGGPGDDIGFVIAAVTVFKDAESEGGNIFVKPQILSIIGQCSTFSDSSA